MKEIIIDIADDGTIKVETRGFTGKDCITESAFLKHVLGKETACNLTPAYFQKKQGRTVKKHLPLCG